MNDRPPNDGTHGPTGPHHHPEQTNPDPLARIATLEGTVSGLRAELASTLRRLDDAELRNRNGQRALEVERQALERQAAVIRDLEARDQVATQNDPPDPFRLWDPEPEQDTQPNTLAKALDAVRREARAAYRMAVAWEQTLEREQAAHRETMAELEQARQDHQRACETIAAMHEAGTGRSGLGPIRGVVEDLEDVRRDRDELLRRERDLTTERDNLERARDTLVDAVNAVRRTAEADAAQARKDLERLATQAAQFQQEAQDWHDLKATIRRMFDTPAWVVLDDDLLADRVTTDPGGYPQQ